MADAEDGVGRPFRGVAADDATYVRGRSAHRRRRAACDGRWHCVSSRMRSSRGGGSAAQDRFKHLFAARDVVDCFTSTNAFARVTAARPLRGWQ